MLVPPPSGVLSSVDPLRKRPTTFSRSTAPKDTDNTTWLETPAEKAQRLADEVAGIKRKRLPNVGGGRDDEEVEARGARDRDIKREVEKHNVRLRLVVFKADWLRRLRRGGPRYWINMPLTRRKTSQLRFGTMIEIWASLADFSPTKNVKQRSSEF